MHVGQPDVKLFAIWQSHIPRIVSTLQLKYSMDAFTQHNLIIVPPIQTDNASTATSQYIHYLIADSISKYFIKNGIHHTTVWGFNPFSLSSEIAASVQTILSYEDIDMGTIKAQKNEEITYQANVLFLHHEKLWWNILTQSGILFPQQMLYYTNHNTIIEIVWFLLSKLWNRHRVTETPRIDLYWPTESIFLLESEVKNRIPLTDHKISSHAIDHKENLLFYDTISGKNILATCKLKGISAGRLSASILTETKSSIRHQEILYESLISQLLHLKELGYIARVERRLDLFINPKDDPTFTIASVKRPRWTNWEVDEEVAQKVALIKKEIETIEENIIILEKIHTILEDEADIRVITWFTHPHTIPAMTALAIDPHSEYALYYLESEGYIVIVAESQAIQVLSMTLPPEKQPGSEILMLLENKIDGGEYFTSQNIPIHKLVSLQGEDLIGLEFEPLFNIDPSRIQNMSPFIWTIVPYNELDTTVGTGLYAVTPPYGKHDYKIAHLFDLPFIETIDEHSTYIFQSHTSPEATSPICSIHDIKLYNYMIDTLDMQHALFATTQNRTHEYVIRSYDAQKVKAYLAELESNKNLPQPLSAETNNMDELYNSMIRYEEVLHYTNYINYITKVVLPEHKTLEDIDITEVKKCGIPFPLWKCDDGTSIFIDNIQSLLSVSLNPIYTLINSRKLAPDLYKDASVVVLGDRNTTLPLGLTVVFYKSIALTEMRKIRSLTLKEFIPFGKNLLEEVYTIFNKYPTVQILLEPHEQELLTMWLGGYSPRSNVIEEKFYFYNPLHEVFISDEKEEFDLPDNTIITQNFGIGKTHISKKYYVPSPEIKQLSLKRPFIDDIILEDGTGKVYTRVSHVVSNTYMHSLLMDGAIWHELVYNSSPQKSFQHFALEDSHIPDAVAHKLGFTHQIDTILISHPHITTYIPFQLDIAKKHNTVVFPSSNTLKHDFSQHPQPLTMHELLSLIETYGSDSLRFLIFEHIDSPHVIWNIKKVSQTAQNLSAHILSIQKYLQSLLNKFPRNNQPPSKQKYKHHINTWLQTYTINYCLQSKFYMENGDFKEIASLYHTYLRTLTNWYFRVVRLLDHSILPEVTECLCESLYWFSVNSFHIQPITCETLFQQLPISQWTEYACFSHPIIEFKEPSLLEIELLDTMQHIKQCISHVEKIRRRHKIKLKHPLYCDISHLSIHPDLLDIILKSSNLHEKPTKHAPQYAKSQDVIPHIELVQTQFGVLKVDSTVYEELTAQAYGWEIERAIIDFLKRNEFSRSETHIFKLALGEYENEEIIIKAMNTVDWHKLHIEVRWDKETDRNSYHISIPEIGDIYLEHITES